MDCGVGGDIVAGIEVASTSNASISSVVIGGVTAAQRILASRSFSGRAAIYTASGVPSGVQNVAVTMSGSSQDYGAQIYNIAGQSSLIPASTASDATHANPTATLNVPVGGAVIGAAHAFSGSPSSANWSGITKDFQDVDGTTAVATSAHGNFAAANPSLSTTCTFTAGGTPGSVGVWAVFSI